MALISVIIKEPGKAPKHVRIKNSLKSQQEQVGGYVETFYPEAGGIMVVNEEGAINGMAKNCRIDGVMIYGVIVWAGQDRKYNLADCPVSWKNAKAAYPQMFEIEE